MATSPSRQGTLGLDKPSKNKKFQIPGKIISNCLRWFLLGETPRRREDPQGQTPTRKP